MKKSFVNFLLLFGFVSILYFSCGESASTGMGTAIDTEAPSLKITSPEHFSYVMKTFTVTGTCDDKIRVEKVRVKYEYSVLTDEYDDNGNPKMRTVEGERYATLSADRKSWTCEITTEDDAEITVSAFAIDARENEGPDYTASVSVVVDTAAPKISNILVKRNGSFQVNLSKLDALKKKVTEGPEKSSNKDYFQNEEFTITADLTEDNALLESYLSLFDEDGNPLIEKQEPDGGDKTTSSPEWTIKGADLIAKNAKYASGVHYLFPKITVVDEAENTDSRAISGAPKVKIYEYEIFEYKEEALNSARSATPSTQSDPANGTTSDVGKYICWWPESDVPKAAYPLYSGDGISIQRDSIIPVDIFDDDEINVVYYGLIDGDTKTEIGTTKEKFAEWLAANKNNTSKFEKVDMSVVSAEEPNAVPNKIYALDFSKSSTITRDTKIAKLNSGSSAMTYSLLIAIEDKKTISGYTENWKQEYTRVSVESTNRPIIIVSSPLENTSADLTNVDANTSKFTISGFTLDDNNVSKMAIAWLPLGNEQEEKALTELGKFNFSADTTTSDGIKIYNMTTTAQSSVDSEFGKYKNEYSHDFNVLDGGDFMYDGELQNKNKLFIIYVKDTEDNETYKTFRLGSYTADPTIGVWYSMDNLTWKEFSATLIQLENTSTIYFKIKPTGANGLGINEAKAKVKGTDVEFSSGPDGDGYYYFETSGMVTGGIDLEFLATDKLGNKVSQKNTIVFGDNPVLKNLSTGVKDGITLVKGEVLKIQANFSMSVAVGNSSAADKPYILLSNITINGVTPTEPQKAVYASGSGSDTLIFEYTVPEDAESAQVETPNTTNPITDTRNLIGGVIETGTAVPSISEKTKVKLDAVSPKVTGVSLDSDGKTVIVTFSEPIEAESGTVTVQRTENWGIPPVLDDETFKAIYNSRSSAEKIKLMGSDDGSPELLEGAAAPKGPYKRITHGLDMSGDDAVPDTSTKYVLAFDYEKDGTEEKNLNIFANTGIVAEIREILEDYGYHKTEFDVSECTVGGTGENEGKELHIPCDESLLVPGREFEVILDEGCVRDDAGNTNSALDRGNGETITTPGVAKPFIIVDRYTHGNGFAEPNASGELGDKITTDNDSTTAPTGYARVRILCETPGVEIKYGVLNKESESRIGYTFDTTPGFGKTMNIELKDATKDEVEKISATTNYVNAPETVFVVGGSNGGNWDKSSKHYIKATATKGTATETAYEGAYRTIIYNANPGKKGDANNPMQVQGSDSQGEPVTAGFPMRDASTDLRYSREMYRFTDSDVTATNEITTNDFILVSWEIVTWFRMQTHTDNWSKEDDVNCKYGWFIYSNGREYW